jgi:hypothetical protein
MPGKARAEVLKVAPSATAENFMMLGYTIQRSRGLKNELVNYKE